jgi:hypothetical protein
MTQSNNRRRAISHHILYYSRREEMVTKFSVKLYKGLRILTEMQSEALHNA